MWAVLLTAGVVHLATLLRTPEPFVDEAWFASRAWAFIDSGHAFGTLDSGVMEQFEGYWTFFPWLGTAVQSLPMRVLGASLFSTRLTSLLFGLGLLVAVYVVGKVLGGKRLGVLAMILTAASRAFANSAHLGRQDIMVAALGAGALALQFTASGNRGGIRNLASGLLVGLAFEVHPNGMIYALPLAAVLLFRHRRFAFRALEVWATAAGLLLGLVFYLGLHVFPYPRTYFGLIDLLWGTTRTPPLLSADLGAWQDSITQTVSLLGVPLAALAIVSLLTLAWKPSRADAYVLIISAALVFGFVGLIRAKWDYYAILLVPVLCIAIAAALFKVGRLPNRTVHARYLSGVAWCAVALLFARNLSTVSGDGLNKFDATLDSLGQVVPANALVVGSQIYWFGLHNQPYLSWEQLIYYQRAHPGSRLSDALLALHPDVFIIDQHIRLFIADDSDQLPAYARLIYLPRFELSDFLNRRAHLVLRLEGQSSGPVEVYKLDW